MCVITDLSKIRTKKDIICYKVLKYDKEYFRAPYHTTYLYMLNRMHNSRLTLSILNNNDTNYDTSKRIPNIGEIKHRYRWLKEYCGYTIYDTLKYILNNIIHHNRIITREGLYTFLDQDHAIMIMEDFCIHHKMQTYSVVKCIIPAGSNIYVNLTTEVIVSNCLFMEEVIDSLQYNERLLHIHTIRSRKTT